MIYDARYAPVEEYDLLPLKHQKQRIQKLCKCAARRTYARGGLRSCGERLVERQIHFRFSLGAPFQCIPAWQLKCISFPHWMMDVFADFSAAAMDAPGIFEYTKSVIHRPAGPILYQ